MTEVGRALSRVDGRKKVTGEARYAAEQDVPGLLHGVVVNATIARGTITTIDTAAALAVPGVLHVITHENRRSMPWFDRSYKDDDQPPGHPFRPLYDAKIQFNGQPIALVVADTFEAARYAASLVGVTYESEPIETDLAANRAHAREPKKWVMGRKPPPKPRGKADEAFAAAAVKIESDYVVPPEHHNPMELFASTVVYETDGSLTIHDKTQGVSTSQAYVCRVFDLDKAKVRVVSPFVGGAFGSGLRPQHQLFFAVMAALELKRSVRVELTRQQMFDFGHRPAAIQRVALGATAEGKLTALIHENVSEVSRFEDYVETTVNWGSLLYACDNTRASHQVVPLDLYTPLDMRAPGATTGLFAFESALDELACAAGIDPIEIRLRNYTDRAIDEGKDFSSKELRACYAQGAERFGWSKRTSKPGSMRRGDKLVGQGMAGGCWDAMMLFASAAAKLTVDGKLTVASGTSDIGTGTYTIMTQIAADTLGLPMDSITFELGDTSLPAAPLQGGSWTAVTVGSAVKQACEAIAKKLFELAKKDLGKGVKLEDVTFEGGRIQVTSDPARSVSITEAMRAGGELVIEGEATALPSPKRLPYAHNVHSAVFVEVEVDETLGVVEVTRVVSAIAGGKILNPKTASSQISGAVVWGISMALHEESLLDHRYGRFMNHNLSEYHLASNADVGSVEVIFVEEHDEHVNALGAKGLGEIGILGVAAAIANAVHHATGVRVRSLPVTMDKIFPLLPSLGPSPGT